MGRQPLRSGEKAKERILTHARDLFLKAGFSKVTMEEIAYGLGMSKKTLYKYFPSKNDLLWEIIRFTTREVDREMGEIVGKDGEFIEKLRDLMTHAAFHYSNFSRPLIADLQRYAPDMWKSLDDFRRRVILESFGGLVREGVRLGYFRSDLAPDLLVVMYAETIQRIINPETLSRLPFTALQAYESIIRVFFEGVLTPDGREKYYASVTA